MSTRSIARLLVAAFLSLFAIGVMDAAPQELHTSVQSKDGTPIAVFCRGSGPALLLVHGGTGDHTRWDSVVPTLSESFHVCAMDRRGHGQSGDAQAYAIEREFADVAAVADSLEQPVILIGHSFGAICALEASLRTRRIVRLVLYEPPFPVRGPLADRDVLARFEGLIQQGQKDTALELFLREIVKLPEARIAAARKEPSWAARAQAVGLQVREVKVVDAYGFIGTKYQPVKSPVLLVMGTETAEHHRAAVEALSEVLPSNRVAMLQGQGHDALQSAPKVFVDAILEFLNADAN